MRNINTQFFLRWKGEGEKNMKKKIQNKKVCFYWDAVNLKCEKIENEIIFFLLAATLQAPFANAA